MSKESIWKRMGGWFRRSQPEDSGSDVLRHDAENIVITDDIEKNERTMGNLLTPRLTKTSQLAAMEQGFSQLIGVLESLNENVSKQQNYIAQVQTSLKNLPEFNRTQIDHLSQMVRHLESSISTETKMAGALDQIDNSMRMMSSNGEKLNGVLHSLNDILRQNEVQIQRMIRNQNRRFTWMLIILGVFVLTAVILTITIISGMKTL